MAGMLELLDQELKTNVINTLSPLKETTYKDRCAM